MYYVSESYICSWENVNSMEGEKTSSRHVGGYIWQAWTLREKKKDIISSPSRFMECKWSASRDSSQGQGRIRLTEIGVNHSSRPWTLSVSRSPGASIQHLRGKGEGANVSLSFRWRIEISGFICSSSPSSSITITQSFPAWVVGRGVLGGGSCQWGWLNTCSSAPNSSNTPMCRGCGAPSQVIFHALTCFL